MRSKVMLSYRAAPPGANPDSEPISLYLKGSLTAPSLFTYLRNIFNNN